jgi:hypothetical protein
MRTILIIAGGLVLLGVCILAGRLTGGENTKVLASAALAFLPLWLVAAGVNMYIGVAQAGYSVREEFPIFLAIFAIPAAAAAFVWWKFS